MVKLILDSNISHHDGEQAEKNWRIWTKETAEKEVVMSWSNNDLMVGKNSRECWRRSSQFMEYLPSMREGLGLIFSTI